LAKSNDMKLFIDPIRICISNGADLQFIDIVFVLIMVLRKSRITIIP